MEGVKKTYNEQYEKWVPWLEDVFLRYFTKDNKASYTAKDNLSKTKITGVKEVDALQDGVNNAVGDQLGQEGLARPVDDLVSKEGLNRFERQGKDEQGQYVGPSTVTQAGQSVAGAAKTGAESVGGAVGGLFGASGGSNK
ncbi:hypothetical protein RB595_006200 [Gaeumannomyces hyphopodioides]